MKRLLLVTIFSIGGVIFPSISFESGATAGGIDTVNRIPRSTFLSWSQTYTANVGVVYSLTGTGLRPTWAVVKSYGAPTSWTVLFVGSPINEPASFNAVGSAGVLNSGGTTQPPNNGLAIYLTSVQPPAYLGMIMSACAGCSTTVGVTATIYCTEF